MIETYLRHLRAAGQAKGTVHNRFRWLTRVEDAIGKPLAEASTVDLERFLAEGEWARETRRSATSVLSGYFKWLYATGQRLDNPTATLPKVKPSEPTPRPTPEKVIHQALAEADDRARLMIRLGAEAGLRRCEISQVNVNDILPDLLGFSLLVHGKGGKLRTVPLNDPLARDVRRACMAGGGWAFPGGVAGHLGAARVGEIMTDLLPAGITPHSLRHRFASKVWAETGGDLLTVMKLLGHASPDTTLRYVAMGQDKLRNAALTAALAA
jgi:integrase